MKKRWLLLSLGLVLVLLTVVAGTVLAKGSKKQVVLFDNLAPEFVGPGTPLDACPDSEEFCPQMKWYPCEGLFMTTGSGIIHEWRGGAPCLDWGMGVDFHLVFKPIAEFPNDDPAVNPDAWADDAEPIGCNEGPWTLDQTYSDADPDNVNDDKNMADIFGDREYWSCVYLWEHD